MADSARSVLAFRVSEAVFAVRLSDIKEIVSLPPKGITRAPAFPKCVLGIINVRGRIVPIIDTWLLMDERESDGIRDRVVCLYEQNGETVGFAADELLGTTDDFDECETVNDASGKKRLCPAEYRASQGIVTGLIKTGDIYAAARNIASKGVGA